MKVVVIFFIFLCANLLGIHHNAQAISFSYTTNLSSEALHASKDYKFATHTGFEDENTYLVTVDDEDEEEVIKKYIHLGRYLLAFSCTFLINYKFRDGDSCLPVCYHQSYTGVSKYIVQRVLKI